MSSTTYADLYRNVNFREEPEKYVIGRGEQGVLIAEPYKSEILPYWRFATPDKALRSAKTIYHLFTQYGKRSDFVGMDMARKFLQMGFTRARRYANHASGKKYDAQGQVKAQDSESEASRKAESARIFLKYYRMALNNKQYIALKTMFQKQKIDTK
jgi:hypothetical protein